jgi:hypothetical protein
MTTVRSFTVALSLPFCAGTGIARNAAAISARTGRKNGVMAASVLKIVEYIVLL